MLADVAPLLDGLPLLAGGLAELDQSELRTLFEVIQLEVAFVPDDDAIDVRMTLSDHWQSSVLREMAEDWLVPPAGFEPATHGLGNRCSLP